MLARAGWIPVLSLPLDQVPIPCESDGKVRCFERLMDDRRNMASYRVLDSKLS